MKRRTLIQAGAVLAATTFTGVASAAEENTKEGKAMKKTLVIVSHPYPDQSTFTKTFEETARGMKVSRYAIWKASTVLTAVRLIAPKSMS